MNTNEEEEFLLPHPNFSPEQTIAFAQIKAEIAKANAEIANASLYEGMTPAQRLQFKKLGT